MTKRVITKKQNKKSEKRVEKTTKRSNGKKDEIHLVVERRKDAE